MQLEHSLTEKTREGSVDCCAGLSDLSPFVRPLLEVDWHRKQLASGGLAHLRISNAVKFTFSNHDSTLLFRAGRSQRRGAHASNGLECTFANGHGLSHPRH